ncbi:MAG: RidA family protein [Chloroflexota bacterium]|nr:RidA family protein [Chloroflexota bacterium]
MRVIASSDAPAAIGPYSQAIQAGGFIFSAGQIPLDPATMQTVASDVTSQTEQVLRNLEAILETAGTSLARVVKTTCFLTDLGDFAAFNEVYARFFRDATPARSTVQVSALPRGVLVEVECIALAGESANSGNV